MTSFPTSSTKLFNWIDGLLAVGTAIVALLLYQRTLAPGLLPGDGGEFQTLAALWGHSHPTGYPVYLTLAKLFAFLPFGEMAYRVNLFSAFMGALTAVGLYVAGRLLTRHRAVAAVGAFALIVSPTLWSQAIIAEVYTAASAFIVWTIVALLWQSRKAVFVAGLLGGLSIGVHMSVALLVPAAILFVVHKMTKDVIANVKTAVYGTLIGLAITILLFLAMNWHNPNANYFNSVIEPSRSAWGLAEADIDGPLERLWFGWSAKQFRTFLFDNVDEVMPQQAAEYWQNLPTELGISLIVFAGIGLIYLLVTERKTAPSPSRGQALFLSVALLIQLITFFNYEIWDLYVFYIPSYLLLILLAIAGMGGVLDGGLRLLKFAKLQKFGWLLDVGVATAVTIFAIIPTYQPQHEAVLAGAVPFEFDEYPVTDYALNTLHPLVTAVVQDLPQNAIVFTDWDMLYPFYYAATVENGLPPRKRGVRNDLTFIETYPADDQDGVADSVIEYVSIHVNNHPIYFPERLDELTAAGFLYAPARVGPLRMVKLIAP